jgi:N-acetylglucosamine-6-phosphate deacetylase
LRLATVVPAAFLGVADRLGRISPRHRADMVVLDPTEIRVSATWISGRDFTNSEPSG